MTHSRPFVLPLITLAIGGGIGFFGGKLSVPAPASPSAPETPVPAAQLSSGAETTSSVATRSADTAKPSNSKPEIPKLISPEELQTYVRANGIGSDMLLYSPSSLRAMQVIQERLQGGDLAEMAVSMSSAQVAPPAEVFVLVMRTFAEQDPEAAWTLAGKVKFPGIRRAAQIAVLTALGESDPEHAMMLIDSLSEASRKQEQRGALIWNLAQRDPQRAWDFYQRNRAVFEVKGAKSSSFIFSTWALRDPEAAKAAASGLSGAEGDEARASVVDALAHFDPQAAWSYAVTVSAKGDKRLLQRVVHTWAEMDPEAALRAASSIEEARFRGSATLGVVRSWSQNDLDGALRYAIAQNDAAMRSDMLRSMSASDSEGRQKLLTALVEHMPAGDNYQRAVGDLIEGWAKVSPKEAVVALNSLPASRLQDEMIPRVAARWSEEAGDKREVLDWMRQLPAGESRNHAYRNVFSKWSGREPQEAMAALSGLNETDRRIATEAVAAGWSERDPEAVVRWASGIQDPTQRGAIVEKAIGQWARLSPENAARYFQTQPLEVQNAAIRPLIEHWASKDVSAAAQWLQNQPATLARDGAIEVLAAKIAKEDPQTAVAWAVTISDPGKRNGQVERIARDWLRVDAASAKAWIARSSLPEDAQARLLK